MSATKKRDVTKALELARKVRTSRALDVEIPYPGAVNPTRFLTVHRHLNAIIRILTDVDARETRKDPSKRKRRPAKRGKPS